jgi:hypothetical protein
MSEDKLRKFNELVDRLRRLPVKTTDDIYFIAGCLEAMYDIKKKAEKQGFQGRIGKKPSHTWEEWLEYWEKSVMEMEEAAKNLRESRNEAQG